VVGVGFMAILLVMRAVEYPFQWLYCIVGIPWLGSILALYYDRVKIGIGLFAGFVVFYLVMLPGI
jgi:Zn-dependent membrane protease YugP